MFLGRFRSPFQKLLGRENRNLVRKIGLASLEGSLKGFGQILAFESNGLAVAPDVDAPDVVEVFHASVGLADANHSVDFFGNDRFGRVGLQFRLRKVQKARTYLPLSRGDHRIPESHVYLQRETGGPNVRDQLGAEPLVNVLLPNRGDLKGLLLMRHSVFRHVCLTGLDKNIPEPVGTRRAMSQKVKVASLAAELSFPDQKGNGALQREVVSFWKLPEPVQETLQRKASQDNLVIFTCAAGTA